MKQTKIIFIVILITIMLSGCGGLLTTATPTPTATNTPQPTATATATLTPTPTMTPTPTPATTQPPILAKDTGLYSVYDHQRYGFGIAFPNNHATLSDVTIDFSGPDLYFQGPSRKYIVILWTEEYKGGVDFGEIIDDLVEAQSLEFPNAEFTVQAHKYIIGGRSARIVEMVNIEPEAAGYYEWIMLDLKDGRMLFIEVLCSLAYFNEAMAGEIAEIIGFIDMTLTTYEPYGESHLAECLVSGDPTYGFSPDNPIFTGGGGLGNINQAPNYLDNLYGPDLQVVKYFEVGVVEHNGVYIHEFELTYEGLENPVHIFVNTDHWETLMAPAGFNCLRPFYTDEP